MQVFDKVRANDLERRELQLTSFASIIIAIMAIGTAVLMYPVVFAHQSGLPPSQEKTLRIAFFGFCSLSLLLAGYLWDRQRVIRRLHREMAADRKRIVETQRQASVDVLKTMANFSSFQDRLPMEFRRTVSSTQKLSVLVAEVMLPKGVSASGDGSILLADAAKTIARRLREQDSFYMLGPTHFCVVLSGTDSSTAKGFLARINEGLSDAAGAANRFSFKTKIINYPDDASSATELEQAVCALLPADNSMSQALAHATA